MKELYCSLPKLVKSVPLSVLTTFLERSCCLPLAAETFDAGLAVSVMQGLSASLKTPDPPQSVMAILFQATGKIYSMMPSIWNVSGVFFSCKISVLDILHTTLDRANATSKHSYLYTQFSIQQM